MLGWWWGFNTIQECESQFITSQDSECWWTKTVLTLPPPPPSSKGKLVGRGRVGRGAVTFELSGGKNRSRTLPQASLLISGIDRHYCTAPPKPELERALHTFNQFNQLLQCWQKLGTVSKDTIESNSKDQLDMVTKAPCFKDILKQVVIQIMNQIC